MKTYKIHYASCVTEFTYEMTVEATTTEMAREIFRNKFFNTDMYIIEIKEVNDNN